MSLNKDFGPFSYYITFGNHTVRKYPTEIMIMFSESIVFLHITNLEVSTRLISTFKTFPLNLGYAKLYRRVASLTCEEQ